MAREKAVAPKTRLRITQVRSGLGRNGKQRATLRALGLLYHQHMVEHNDGPAIRGMIFQVQHLVRVEDIPASEA